MVSRRYLRCAWGEVESPEGGRCIAYGGVVYRLHRAIRLCESFLLTAAILVMAATTISNVVLRGVTGGSLAAAEELNQFLIVLVCFVGLSHAAGEGRHIRMTAVSDALPIRVRRAVLMVVLVGTAAVLLVLTAAAVSYASSVDRSSPVMGVPVRWVFLIAPLGMIGGAVHYLAAAWRTWQGPGLYVAWDVEDGAPLTDERGL